MTKVRISFSGVRGSGKTMLSRFIRRVLKEQGLKIEEEPVSGLSPAARDEVLDAIVVVDVPESRMLLK